MNLGRLPEPIEETEIPDIGFDEKAIDEQEYQKDWMYQVNFADKMKENGIVPKIEHVHGIKSELNQTVSHR